MLSTVLLILLILLLLGAVPAWPHRAVWPVRILIVVLILALTGRV